MQKPGQVLFQVDGQAIATYVYEDPKILRPYFMDLKAPSGVQITRHHPPRPGLDADDHATMHPGLWLAFGDISAHDFWRKAFHLGDEAITVVEPGKSLSLGFGILIHSAADEASVDLHAAYEDYLRLKDDD